jgi:hypothetical protein
MFKNLKIYYFFISLPYVLVLCGAAIFSDGIKYTIVRNPHPQINYTIFAIILIGGILVLLNAKRLMNEVHTMREFFAEVHANKSWSSLQQLANSYTGETACLLQMVATSGGRFITHQEQVSIENELNNTRSSLLRRNALPSYLTGLLVGMGLLGTFIGLLATLSDITALITSFADLDMQNASPLLVFRTMIDKMRAPMQSMGIAFSASMFGLLGSIIMGLMMVGLRRLQGDTFSFLSSEVARHIEIALAQESVVSQAQEENAAGEMGGVPVSDITKVLFRIEERYADASRAQQRALTVLLDDIQKQRAELMNALTAQTEASNSTREEMQQATMKLGTICNMMEKSDKEISPQLSELVVQVTAGTKENNKLLAQQLEEQKRLQAALDSYKIEERLAEAARTQQRTLSSVIGDFKEQRAETQRALVEQTTSNNSSGSQLQQLVGLMENVFSSIEKGNQQIIEQLSELTVHTTSDAKETHLLLNVASDNFRINLKDLENSLAERSETLESNFSELSDIVAKLSEQTASGAKSAQDQARLTGDTFQKEIQQLSTQLDKQLEKISSSVQNNTGELSAKMTELISTATTSTARTEKDEMPTQTEEDQEF